MDYDEPDYSKVSHAELLALAEKDSLAAQEFFHRYRYSDDPVLKTEVREVLRSLAEDFDHSGFWPDWYATLCDSNDPKEQCEAQCVVIRTRRIARRESECLRICL